MKKQLRLVLFALLIAILVVMTAIGVSAATDGADAREEGHYYQVVSGTDGATPKYYTTLANAIAAVDADGTVITVLENVTEPAIALDKAFAYTISGGANGATVTFTGKDSKGALINATAGTVTLDSLTVAYSSSVAFDYVVYLNGATGIVLNNVVTSAPAAKNTVYANAASSLTVSGAKTDISGATAGFFANAAKAVTISITDGKITSGGYILLMNGATTVTVTGGELVSGANSVFRHSSNRSSAGSSIAITNATVTAGAGEGIFYFQVGASASIGVGASIGVDGGAVFEKMHKNVTVALDGGEIHLKSAGAVLYPDGTTTTGTVTTNSGKIYLYSGADVPAASLDSVFDWTKLTFTVVGINGEIELTEAGTYNITSPADLGALAAVVARKAFDATRFAGVTIEVSLDVSVWIPIVINGEGVVVNITAGTFKPSEGDCFATLKNGALNITGGSFTGNEGVAFLSVSGGALTISGGTFVGATNVIDATAGIVAVTGGTFTLKGFADSVSDAAFLKHTGEAALEIGALGGNGPTVTLGASVSGTKFAKGIVLTNEAAQLTVNSGNFVAENAGNVLFDVPAAIAKLEIKGGSFSITGSGAALLSGALDKADNGVTVTGGTVSVSDGAVIPVFDHINTSALSLVLEGALAYRITSAGDFVIASSADIYDLIRAYFTTSVTVVGKEAPWIALTLDCADATVTVTGGNYTYGATFFTVNAGTLNILGGTFTAEGDSFIKVTGGKLTISGGAFKDLLKGVAISGGEVTISGGDFTASSTAAAVLVEVAGKATVAITPNAAGGSDPTFTLPVNNSSYGLLVSSSEANVTISGGAFGNLKYASSGTYYALGVSAAAIVNISGGIFIGGSSGTAVRIAGDGAVLSITDGSFYGFKNVTASAAATINISGGSYNPIMNLTTGALVSTKARLIEATNEGAEVYISGGVFQNYINAVYASKAATFTVTGGVFTPRTTTSDTESDAFAYFTTTGTTLILGDEETGVGPVVNLDYVNPSDAAKYAPIYTRLFNVKEGAEINVTVYGGTFNAKYAANKFFDFVTAPSSLQILGGSYVLPGEGSEIMPAELLANPAVTVRDITVTVCDGAPIPFLTPEINKTITLILAGEIKEIEILSGTYVINGLDDIYAIIAASYKSVTVEERAASGWIPIHINGDDVDVTLNNIIDAYHGAYMVRVTKGKLTVNGGDFAASADEKLFEVLGNVTVIFNGGSYKAVGAYSYILYIAEGVDTSNISMKGANLFVSEFGSAPVQVDFTMVDNTITVNGLSEIRIDKAGEYTISSASDLTAMVKEALLSKFEADKITVEIYTWVPLHLNHPDAVLNIAGGQYAGGAPFFFRLSAGTINITGGKFNNAMGDLIHLTGTGTVNIDLPTSDASHGFVVNGSMIYAEGASNTTVTIKGGYFMSSLPDTKNDETKAFIYYKGEMTGMSLVIEDGHFEATRILRLEKANVNVAIKGGEFVSDFYIDNDLVLKRATNAHMFVLDGAGAVLSIEDGSFENRDGNYLFVLKEGAELTISGGAFNASGWFNVSGASKLTVNANTDPEKDPTFTDTSVLALDDYFIIDLADGQVVLNAGTFTAGTSEYFVFDVQKGNLTVNGGTYMGSLFHITANSAITLSDGVFTASGRQGALFALDGTITAANLTLSKELTFAVEKNAAIIDTKMGANAVKALLANANVTVTDYAKAALSLSGTLTFTTPADLVNLIKTYLPEGKLNFVFEQPVCGLVIYGAPTVFVTGGDWTYDGDILFKVTEGAPMTFTGGNFAITNGGLVHVVGTGTTLVFGDANDSQLYPTIAVQNGLKALLYTDAKDTAITIYNGSFTANDYKDFNMFLFEAEIATVTIHGGNFQLTKGSQYDADTGTKLLNCSAMFYTNGFYVDGTAKGTAVVNVNVYGGSFTAARIMWYYYSGGAINIYGGSFTSNSYAYSNPIMFEFQHKNCQLTVYGGNFTGNKYTASIIRFGNARGSGSNLMKATILGGTFQNGLHWIYLNIQCELIIDKTETTMPVFNDLSNGSGANYGSNVTAHGFYLTAKAKAAKIELKAGRFLMPSSTYSPMFVLIGGTMTIYDGVYIETSDTVFQITSSALYTNLIIKGGTFKAVDVGLILELTAPKVADRTAVVECKFIIEGGNFIATGGSSVFTISSTEPMYSFIIKGGNFSSEDSRLGFVSTSAEATMLIQGGTFTSRATSLLYVDSNVTPVIIEDGTFIFEEKESGGSDAGILYLVGKSAATLVVRGGTFVDKRTSSAQAFIKMNPKGEFKFEGDFKLYVAAQKKNFYFDYNNDSNSVPFMPWTETYNGEQYYVCFGYYNQYAPVITSAPALRPVLGAEGLTFTASVSTEVQAYLATLGTVSYGTLIFPLSYFENGWQNGTDFLQELDAQGLKYVKIPAVNGLVTEADGSLTIRASLVNIKEKNYTMDIAGIAYAKVVAEDGTETYYYASHVSAGVSNNMRAAAKYALNDLNTKAITENGRTYCYPSINSKNKFSRYSTALQYSLRRFLPESERKIKWK